MRHSLILTSGLALLLASCGGGKAPDPTPQDTTRQQPGVLVAGTAQTGVIAGEPRDHDYYTFVGKEGDQLLLTVKAKGAYSDSTLDPYVRVYGPDGYTIFEKDDDSGKDLDSEIRMNILYPGTYTVEVTSFKLINDPEATDDNPMNRYRIELTNR